MFGKKKEVPQIDKEQLELIENAQKRIRQKKRLYIHFVIFLIGAVFLFLANTLFGIGDTAKLFGVEWFVYVIILWLFLFVYHFVNVFITNKFMGKDWEKQQIDKLVNKQKVKIEALKKQLDIKEESNVESEQKKKPKNTTQNLTIIVAAGENNAIGKDNQLIWHLSEDLKRFKRLTSGHHIIMGRKTFESFPKPLPNRTHIVITRQTDYKAPEGVIIVNSLTDALDAVRSDKQPFIIGGGEIYKQAMPKANTLEITRVHHSFENADTFFPEIDKTQWKETSRHFNPIDDKHKYEFSFVSYVRA